jgi:hypothetical protein
VEADELVPRALAGTGPAFHNVGSRFDPRDMPITCMVCSTKLYGDGGGLDVVECPKCRSTTPTGHEKLLRSQLEQYKNHLPYPRIAAGRAIGYAAGIYDLSTHNKRIDTSSIEDKLQQKYGPSGAAEHTSLKAISGRSAAGATDSRAGLMIYKVTGKNYKVGGPKGQEWSIVYVVFRGSRGDKPGEANPKGAGWGKTASGQLVNIDWRSDFNTRQDVPPWSTAVKVHAGFLEIYASVRQEIHSILTAYLAKDPHSTVVTTGHSLGAGLATVCAHDLETIGLCHPVCMPFCSPRVGNLAFVRDFNQKIADDMTVMWSEVDGVSFNRSFVFVQSNDPVTWSGEHGFKHAMSAKSAAQVADSGSIVKQAFYATFKKHKSDTTIFYHVGNLHRASYLGLHDYNKMLHEILG